MSERAAKVHLYRKPLLCTITFRRASPIDFMLNVTHCFEVTTEDSNDIQVGKLEVKSNNG